VTVPVRLDGSVRGQVFLPFHYGQHAANELTPDRWDPVSKQPEFKGSTARVQVVPAEKSTDRAAEQPVEQEV
jgi:predicted molibdopterin-dependent oxidoreductase YjgC